MITYRSIISEPGAEPVSMDECRVQLKVGVTNEAHDDDIVEMRAAARDRVEALTNRYWSRVTVRIGLNAFPTTDRPLYLPIPDIQEVSSITYLDTAQDLQTLTGFTLLSSRQLITYTTGWPIGSYITIELTAGPDVDGSPADIIPAGIKRAILMYMTDYFENRGSQVPYQLIKNKAADAAAWPYRVNMGL